MLLLHMNCIVRLLIYMHAHFSVQNGTTAVGPAIAVVTTSNVSPGLEFTIADRFNGHKVLYTCQTFIVFNVLLFFHSRDNSFTVLRVKYIPIYFFMVLIAIHYSIGKEVGCRWMCAAPLGTFTTVNWLLLLTGLCMWIILLTLMVVVLVVLIIV